MADSQSEQKLLPAGDLLVTGATGFLGGVLVRRLIADGVPPTRLRLPVRDVARAARGGLPEASLFAADLTDPGVGELLRPALRGAGLVVHLAGSLQAYDQAGFDAVNVHGTRRLVEAVVAAAPAAHLVHVSSLAAVGPSRDGAGTDVGPPDCRPVSMYGLSKLGGEELVVASGLPFTVLRPPVVYGPFDGATRVLFQQATGLLTPVPRRSRPLSVIHADDVAEALWCAVQRRPAGAFLPLDGPERTYTHDLMRAIASASERRARLLPIPMVLARLAAHAADLVARLRKRPGHFNRDKVREIEAIGWVADGRPARQILGFEPSIALAEGLRAVVERELAATA